MATAPLPQHLTNSNDHGTPRGIVELARKVLVGIDLDPASTEAHNRTVRAKCIFTSREDGLVQPWRGRVFLNPPGGVIKSKEEMARWKTRSRAVAWWRMLVEEYGAGRIYAAIFIGFNMEILATSQSTEWMSVLDFPFCVPKKRIAFTGKQPTHSNVVVYVGPKANLKKFRSVFSEIGQCR